jgi:thymidylate synthase (FAD)
MKIVSASYEILAISPDHPLQLLELAGRTCYKSEDRSEPGTAETFCVRILESQHESVIEHASMTVRFVCDRGVSHELVRHRLCSFSQESTRYCNYSKEKFGNVITVVRPCFWQEGTDAFATWKSGCELAEQAYFVLVNGYGAKPQEARSVLPNSLKTEIVVTANLRQWRHMFRLRCSNKAHPQMRELMIPLLVETRTRIPVLFDDSFGTG